MRVCQLYLAAMSSVGGSKVVHRSKLCNFLVHNLDRKHNIDYYWFLCVNNAGFCPYCNPNKFYCTVTMALFEGVILSVAVCRRYAVVLKIIVTKLVMAVCSSIKFVSDPFRSNAMWFSNTPANLSELSS